jgi:hypothetical protein
MLRAHHIPANLPGGNSNGKRPELRVGFPNTHQMISVSASESIPDVASQIVSGIIEHSSNTMITRFR